MTNGTEEKLTGWPLIGCWSLLALASLSMWVGLYHLGKYALTFF